MLLPSLLLLLIFRGDVGIKVASGGVDFVDASVPVTIKFAPPRSQVRVWHGLLKGAGGFDFHSGIYKGDFVICDGFDGQSGRNAKTIISCRDILEVFNDRDYYDRQMKKMSSARSSPQPESRHSQRTSGRSQAPKVVDKPKLQYAYFWLHGGVGKEIQSEVLARAFDSLPPSCRLVFLDINTPGGLVIEMEQIRDLIIRKKNEGVGFVAVCDDVLSAGTTFAFACDHIFFKPHSVLGAAVSFRASSSGEIEVDAKRNSALAAKLESLAVSNGHPAGLAYAMVVMSSVVYFSPTQGVWGGNFENRPGGSDWQLLDDQSSILTIDYSMALKIESHSQTIHTMNGVQRLEFDQFDQRAMNLYKDLIVQTVFRKLAIRLQPAEVQRSFLTKHFIREYKNCQYELALLKNRGGLIEAIDRISNDAVASDPDNFNYDKVTTTSTMRLPDGNYHLVTRSVPSREAWYSWYANTDKAIRLWRDMLETIEELVQVESLAKKYNEPHKINQPEVELGRQKARSEIIRLRSNRSRGPQ